MKSLNHHLILGQITSHQKTLVPPPDIELVNFVAYKIIGFGIITLGIIGNLTKLIVLSNSSLKGGMIYYFKAFAISNLCILISAIPALMEMIGGTD